MKRILAVSLTVLLSFGLTLNAFADEITSSRYGYEKVANEGPTVNEQYPQFVDDYDPQYPWKNYIDAFQLNVEPAQVAQPDNNSMYGLFCTFKDMVKIEDGTWHVTNKPFVIGTLAGTNPDATYMEDRDFSVVNATRDFMSSFDWRNATEKVRADKAANSSPSA